MPAVTVFLGGGLAIVDYRSDARLHERPVVERHARFSIYLHEPIDSASAAARAGISTFHPW